MYIQLQLFPRSSTNQSSGVIRVISPSEPQKCIMYELKLSCNVVVMNYPIIFVQHFTFFIILKKKILKPLLRCSTYINIHNLASSAPLQVFLQVKEKKIWHTYNKLLVFLLVVKIYDFNQCSKLSSIISFYENM